MIWFDIPVVLCLVEVWPYVLLDGGTHLPILPCMLSMTSGLFGHIEHPTRPLSEGNGVKLIQLWDSLLNWENNDEFGTFLSFFLVHSVGYLFNMVRLVVC